MAGAYARFNHSLIFRWGFHLAPPQESIDHRQGFLHQENLVRKVPTVSPEVTNELKNGRDQEGSLPVLSRMEKTSAGGPEARILLSSTINTGLPGPPNRRRREK